MPGGVRNGTDYVSFLQPSVRGFLSKADFRLGTLETAVGNKPTFPEWKLGRKQDIIWAKDDDINRLTTLGINVVSLANNHFGDLGYEGMSHTIEVLDNLGIKHCGAGINIEQAGKPAILEKDGKKIAVFAYCDTHEEYLDYVPFATEDKAGVNPLIEKRVLKTITEYKRIVDYIIVMPHWGMENVYVPRNYVIRLAKKMKDAGADMIIGDHPHRVQPFFVSGHTVVAYSLGNFAFFDRFLYPPRPTGYPKDDEDTSNYPIDYGYPWVEVPTLKRTPLFARVGLILNAKIEDDGRMNIEHLYTMLNMDNVIQECDYNLDNIVNDDVKNAKRLIDNPMYRLKSDAKCFLKRTLRPVLRIIRKH